MLDIFQTTPGERALANSLQQQRNVALPPPANPVPRCGARLRPEIPYRRQPDLVGTAPTGHNPSIWNKSKKSTEHDRRKPWTQRLTTARANARSTAPTD